MVKQRARESDVEREASTSSVSFETAERLVECARLLNHHGPDADEVKRFIRQHKDDEEFVQLAELSRTLKKALKGRNSRTPSRHV